MRRPGRGRGAVVFFHTSITKTHSHSHTHSHALTHVRAHTHSPSLLRLRSEVRVWVVKETEEEGGRYRRLQRTTWIGTPPSLDLKLHFLFLFLDKHFDKYFDRYFDNHFDRYFDRYFNKHYDNTSTTVRRISRQIARQTVRKTEWDLNPGTFKYDSCSLKRRSNLHIFSFVEMPDHQDSVLRKVTFVYQTMYSGKSHLREGEWHIFITYWPSQ